MRPPTETHPRLGGRATSKRTSSTATRRWRSGRSASVPAESSRTRPTAALSPAATLASSARATSSVTFATNTRAKLCPNHHRAQHRTTRDNPLLLSSNLHNGIDLTQNQSLTTEGCRLSRHPAGVNRAVCGFEMVYYPQRTSHKKEDLGHACHGGQRRASKLRLVIVSSRLQAVERIGVVLSAQMPP